MNIEQSVDLEHGGYRIVILIDKEELLSNEETALKIYESALKTAADELSKVLIRKFANAFLRLPMVKS